MPNLYDPQVVKNLFEEMSKTYGLVNLISSFGFCRRWRRQCLQSIPIPAHGNAIDLMSGMGELCPDLSRLLGADGDIVAVDISEAMCLSAASKIFKCPVEVVEADVLRHFFPPASADVVVSSFGLKTFSPEQIGVLAGIVMGALKPGGVFSFVEISVPQGPWLRWPYMFYINRIIPLIGLLFLGNPENYRQLGVYTAAFRDCEVACRLFRDAGLDAEYHTFFFGCATGIFGRKPYR